MMAPYCKANMQYVLERRKEKEIEQQRQGADQDLAQQIVGNDPRHRPPDQFDGHLR